ncbi:hypothetical protein [Sphingobium herbicidovorans]
MNRTSLLIAPLCGFLLIATGCSADPQPTGHSTMAKGADNGSGPAASDAASISPVDVTADTSPASPADPKVLALEGLGDLMIGEPVPKGSGWAERGAQIGDACRTVTSPDYPGAYAIVTDGKVQRITLGQRSPAKLAEGIGVGASEADVRKWFAGFREEPHKYEEAPAKYLTAPNASSGSSALRFEIGHDGKVKMIHVGLMPVLAYVEGCA